MHLSVGARRRFPPKHLLLLADSGPRSLRSPSSSPPTAATTTPTRTTRPSPGSPSRRSCGARRSRSSRGTTASGSSSTRCTCVSLAGAAPAPACLATPPPLPSQSQPRLPRAHCPLPHCANALPSRSPAPPSSLPSASHPRLTPKPAPLPILSPRRSRTSSRLRRSGRSKTASSCWTVPPAQLSLSLPTSLAPLNRIGVHPLAAAYGGVVRPRAQRTGPAPLTSTRSSRHAPLCLSSLCPYPLSPPRARSTPLRPTSPPPRRQGFRVLDIPSKRSEIVALLASMGLGPDEEVDVRNTVRTPVRPARPLFVCPAVRSDRMHTHALFETRLFAVRNENRSSTRLRR